MKKFLPGLFAIALAIVFSAFTSPDRTDAANQVSYHWFEYDVTTGDVGDYLGFKTKTQAIDLSVCPNQGNTQCRRGYTSAQLDVPADPEAGPEDEDIYSDNIKKNP